MDVFLEADLNDLPEGSPGQRPEGVIFGFDRARYERL